jgi:hypothetical protein
MNERRNVSNEIKENVKKYRLNRKSQLKDIEIDELNDFLQLSLKSLKEDLLFGSFQLKLSPSY